MENRLNRFTLLAAFFLPLGVYWYTAAPGAFWQDSATFSMAASTLSIAQAPGFPLWVFLAKLATWLVPRNPAMATNLMSGFFAAVAVAFFYLCLNRVLTALTAATSRLENPESTLSPPLVALTALGAALTFAFSQTVWLQAVRAEVYSLQLVLTLSTLLVALALPETEKPARFFLLTACFWGLSLSVHPLLSVSVLPGFLIAACFKSANWKNELAKWGWGVFLVAVAVTPYLYLPIRSAQNPYFNWNPPDTAKEFLAVTSRFPDWQRSIAATALNFSYPNVMRLASFLLSQCSLVFWIVAVIGFLVLARRKARWGLSFFVLLLSNLCVTLWAARFSVRNMDLLGYLSFGTGIAVAAAAAAVVQGAFWLSGRLPRLASIIGWGVPVAAAILIVLSLERNWGKANLHDSRFCQSMTEEMLESLPPRSVVVCWTDRLLTPLLYAQGVLGLRPDVVILPSDFFSWPTMAEQTRQRYPDLVFNLANPASPAYLRVRQGLNAFCRDNHRPIFSELEKRVTSSPNFWPAGYLVQYRRDSLKSAPAGQVLDFVNKNFGGRADPLTRQFMARQVFDWGEYLFRLGSPEGALLRDRAVELDAESPWLWAELGKAEFFSRRLDLAESCFKMSLTFDPYEWENYFLLANVLNALGKVAEARMARREGDWLMPDIVRIEGRRK